MQKIYISSKKYPGKFVIVDDKDYEELSQFNWHISKGHSTFYCHRRTASDHTISIHRHIMKPARGVYVDHKNGDGLLNVRSNLRKCSNAENGRNSRLSKANKSGYKGVGWNGQRHLWRAKITVNTKSIELGFYVCPLRAAKAYNDAAEKYFGGFARPNELPAMNCKTIVVMAAEAK